jgi:sec-independent protein translocase protein TatC
MSRTTPRHPDEMQMSFGDHLEELRARVILSLVGVGVICIATLTYGTEIFTWLCQPLIKAQLEAGTDTGVIGLTPTAAFTTYLKVGLFSGLILASPWLLYQLWKFVSSGLYEHERRIVYILVPFSATMVLLAIAFLYYLMLPICLQFFLGFASKFTAVEFHMSIQASDYISFVIYLALGIVVGFQLPVAMLVGGMSGLLDATWLCKYRGYALLVCAVAGAVLTPTDPVSMLVLMVPLYVLYEFGIVLIRITRRRAESQDDA